MSAHGVVAALVLWPMAALAGASAPSAAGNGLGLLQLGGQYVKWGSPVADGPAEVSYAYLDRPQRFPGARNCGEMTTLDALLRRSGLDRGRFESEVRAAFDLWSRAASIRFAEAADPADADILIGAQATGKGVAFTNVFHETVDDAPIGGIGRATVCLAPTQAWELGVDGDPKTYGVRYVVAHEIGHAIGLDHRGRTGGIMGFAYLEPFAAATEVRLGAADVLAATWLYGAPPPSLLTRGTAGNVCAAAGCGAQGSRALAPADPR
jgi:Matrixin